MTTAPPKPRLITDVIIEVPFAIVPSEAALDKRLTAMHLRVLIAILTFRKKNTDSVCMGRDKIAKRCGYREQTISKVTSDLVALGWLEKKGKGGFSKAVAYRVTVPDVGTVVEDDFADKTVPGSGTVPDPGTVPESGQTTVPDPGKQRFPGRLHAYNRDLTEQSTEVSNAHVVVDPFKPAPVTEATMVVMDANWHPSEVCLSMITRLGIEHGFVLDSIPEFILYWIEARDRERSAGTWHQRFLSHCKRQWERFQAACNTSLPRPIPSDFFPDAETIALLEQRGVDGAFVLAEIEPFRRYWIETREGHRAWNSKFYSQTLSRWLKRPRSHVTLDDKLHDRSWAEETGDAAD